MINVDGSMGEGGGQLLRYSVALAAVLGEEIRIYNIRAKRSNPGLRPQHLNAVRVIARLVDAEVEGLRVGSREVTFRPRRRPRGGEYRVDIGTAGSISLLLQASLPVLAAADGPVTLTVTGGTSVKWAPPVPYLQNVLIPLLSS
ncbi:MAG: RNA 3'-phosphate cyclase, partial [Thermoproteota archaeon]